MRHDDPLPDMNMVRANWLALAVYGHDKSDPKAPSGHACNGIPLSRRSFVMLYAEPSWLMTLWSN